MQLPAFKNYINNQWEDPAQTLSIELCDASTAEVIGQQVNSDNTQVEDAIACADNAFTQSDWASMTAERRAGYLTKIADRLSQKGEQIAQLDAWQTGVVIGSTRQVGMICSAAFMAAANLIQQTANENLMPGELADVKIQRKPLGVAAIIAPWNAPSGIACHKIASALAAGCCVIFKPSEWASGSAQLIAEAIHEASQETNLPSGVFQMLHGNAEPASALVADPRIAAVSFTGGAQGGRAVGRSCGEQIKPAQLELGGNNPMVVLASADLDKAADSIITGLITMNAQWCRALGRIIVDQSVSDDLLNKVRERLAEIKIGPSLDEASQMGAMVHKGHLAHLQQNIEQYKDLGAKVIQDTPVPQGNGYYLAPTLILGLEADQTLEETFGPVACWHTFEDTAQAIAMANQTVYGLAAYVFGEQAEALELAESIRSGMVKINRVTLFNLNPMAPRPAWGKSGLGDEGVTETYEFFRGTRVIGVAG